MNCLKCGETLTGKQIRFCSTRCSKLYLKSEYRKRNREKLNQYNRKQRKLGVRTCGKDLKNRYLHLRTGECFICGCKDNLQIHHIKPRKFGGTNEVFNLMILCKKCHYDIDKATEKLWKIR